jgi:hypothetical protein
LTLLQMPVASSSRPSGLSITIYSRDSQLWFAAIGPDPNEIPGEL